MDEIIDQFFDGAKSGLMTYAMISDMLMGAYLVGVHTGETAENLNKLNRAASRAMQLHEDSIKHLSQIKHHKAA